MPPPPAGSRQRHGSVGERAPAGGDPGGLLKQPNLERYAFHVDREGHRGVDGLDHPQRMFDLAEGLVGRGYSDADIKLILGGSAVRVLGSIGSADDPTI
jgi:microsomal dipeptidase-like Zn-dependent dipeptidase